MIDIIKYMYYNTIKIKTILWGGVEFPTGSESLRKAQASERVQFPYRRYSPERKRMF